MYVLYDVKLLFYGFDAMEKPKVGDLHFKILILHTIRDAETNTFAKTFRAKRIHITPTCTHMYLVNGLISSCTAHTCTL